MALPDDINAPTQGQFIRELYAWIATYPDGTEGIVGVIVPEIGMVSLVTSRPDIARLMENHAKLAAAGKPNMTVRLVTFTTTEGTRQ